MPKTTQERHQRRAKLYRHVRIDDTYRYFRENKDKYGKLHTKVSRSAYSAILREYNAFLLTNAMEGNVSSLPYFGRLFFKNTLPKEGKIDFHHFRKTGEKIPYDNSHTGNYVCKMAFEKTVLYKNWQFVICRMYPSFRKQFADMLRDNPLIHRKYRFQ